MSAATLSSDPAGFFNALYQQSLREATKLAANFQFDTQYRALLDSTSTELNFNVFLSWTILFLVLYVLFALMWKLLPSSGLSEGKLPFIASSRCIGTVHCLIVVPLAMVALTRRNPNWLQLEYLDVSSPIEQRVIELSVGYFVADFVHFILFEPDLLMFFHHVFSIAMMGSAGLIGRAGACAMGALVQVVFVVVRLSVVPFWTFLINVSMWYGPNTAKMPSGYVLWWSLMSVGMVVGGFLWSYSLIKGLKKFYRAKGKVAQENGKKKQ